MAKNKKRKINKLFVILIIFLIGLFSFFTYQKLTEKERALSQHVAAQKKVMDYTVNQKDTKYGNTNIAQYSCSDGIYKIHNLSTTDVTMESVQVGNMVYYKDPREEDLWWKTFAYAGGAAVDANTFCPGEARDKQEEKFKSLGFPNANSEFVEKRPCGELNCFVYRYANTLKPFDDKEFLTRQEIIKGTTGEEIIKDYSYGKVNIATPTGTIKEIEDPENASAVLYELVQAAREIKGIVNEPLQ